MITLDFRRLGKLRIERPTSGEVFAVIVVLAGLSAIAWIIAK